MIHPLEVIGRHSRAGRELREQIPDVLAGYAAMQRAHHHGRGPACSG